MDEPPYITRRSNNVLRPYVSMCQYDKICLPVYIAQIPSGEVRVVNINRLAKDATRKSKRKPRLHSFISYFKSGEAPESSISPPTNFEKKEFAPENVSPHVSIQECPFDVTGYGCLIMKDKFKLKRPMKKKNVIVFMFERIIVFTTEEEKDLYYYIGSIKISDLSMAPPTKKTRIILSDFNKSKITKSNLEYKLKTKSEEVANTWRKAIQKCLWKELITARDKSMERLDEIT
ncbi:hypothetical protein JTB14_014590 [Gonioctena quinquepunctata]|nr:hypothetical protein JTB14_014590 [Gonioctena quinquepunctata]